MKMLRIIRAATILWVALVALNAIGGKPTNTPPGSATNAPPNLAKNGHKAVPPGLGRILHQPGGTHDTGYPALPTDVNSLVQQFQKDQSSYVTQRQQLLDQLKQAGASDRAAIRDQLRDLRDKWQDMRNKLTEDIRDRLQEIKAELKNQRNEQLGDAGDAGGGPHPKK